MRKAVFFDRDGVINELVQRDGGLFSPQTFDQFNIVRNTKVVINKLKKMGFLTIVISNQPDISRGTLKKTELDKITNILLNELMIDDVFYCPHDDSDLCNCRKPAPGLIIQAADKWNIDLQNSYMVGDSWKDMEAAKRAGVTSLLIDADYNRNLDVKYRVKNLLSAVKVIDKLVSERHQVFKEE